MKALLKVFILCLLSGLACQTQRKLPNRVLPNVIVIVTDDQGWGDIGFNTPSVYTPNLDKLAAKGALFTNHYSMPQCTPTRIALFTGRYPGRFGTTGLQATNEAVFPKGISEAVHIVDWFPTLAMLIGYTLKHPAELDGVYLSPVLFENGSIKERDLYWIWNPTINRWALKFGDYKIVKYGAGEPRAPSDWQLFNLVQDPKEETDLSQRQPEVVAQLHQLFVQQRAKDKKGPN